MKILPIFWNKYNQLKEINENNQYDYSHQRQALVRNPQADYFKKSSVLFTGKEGPDRVSPSRQPLEKLYKYHLPCLCCGREMIDPKEIRALEKSGALQGTALEVIESLEKYENNMHAVEKEVFGIIKKEAKEHPEMNIPQIFRMLKPEHEDTLIKTQFGIFKMIEKASENINPELKKQIKELIEQEKVMILAGNNQFRRKKFVNQFEDIFKDKKNSATKEHLIRLANKLPTAYEDKNAFIVKYCNYPSEAIGLRLLSYSMCTIEHVHPKNKDGENHIFNYIPECMRCNSFRADRPMIQQLEEHPEMFVNAQKLMDRLVDFANREKLSKWYIVKIQDRVKTESERVLDLDISKLDMTKKMRREYAKMQTDPVDASANNSEKTTITVDEEMAELRKIYKKDSHTPKTNTDAKKTPKELTREKIKEQRKHKARHKNETTGRR